MDTDLVLVGEGGTEVLPDSTGSRLAERLTLAVDPPGLPAVFGDRGDLGSPDAAAALALEDAVPCINLDPEDADAGVATFAIDGLTGVVTGGFDAGAGTGAVVEGGLAGPVV